MPEEAEAIIGSLDGDAETTERGRRVFHSGMLRGHQVVVVVSRVGKVAAAATTTELITGFGVDAIIFTGVAGGLGPGVGVGDLVIATELVQHDLDARPLWPKHIVPLLETGWFRTDERLTAALRHGAEAFAASGAAPRPEGGDARRQPRPCVHSGLIASGDLFVTSADDAARIRSDLPKTLCVEMEGAAAAQVAHEYGVPFAVCRVVSDRADGDAAAHFEASLGSIAAACSAGVIASALGVAAT